MGLFHRFVRKLGVEGTLERALQLPRREGQYGTGRMLISLIYALALDLNRLSDTVLLRLDKVFQKLVGFEGYPHQPTFSRFLAKFTVPVAKGIGEVKMSIGSEISSRNFSVRETSYGLAPDL